MKARDFILRAGALTASRGVQDALQTVLLLWLARVDQSGYGLFVFGAGVAAMARSILALGLDQFTLREFAADEASRGRVLSGMVRIKAVLGWLILGGLAAWSFFKGWNSTQATVVLVVAAGRVLDGLAETFFSLFRAEGRQVREGAYSVAANLIGALFGAVCLFFGWGVTAFSFFLVFSSGLKLLLACLGGLKMGLLPSLRLKGRLLPARELRSLIIIAAVSVLGAFYNSTQIFLLKKFCTLNEVALYGAAADTAGFTGLVSTMIVGAVLFPSLVAAAAAGGERLVETVRVYFWQLFIYGAGAAFFLSTLGGPVLTLLYGSKYAAAVRPLIVLGPAVLLSFLNNFAIMTMLALGREQRLAIYHLAPAGLALGLGWALIPSSGPLGAAVNLLACRAMMSLLVIGWLQRRLSFIRWLELRAVLKSWLAPAAIYLALVWLQPLLAAGLALTLWAALIGFETASTKRRLKISKPKE